MDLNSFKVDVDKSEDGTWVELDGSTRLRIKRYGNKSFRRKLRQLMAPHKLAAQRGDLPEEITEKALMTAMSEEILVGWEGMVLDGQAVDYSSEKVLEIFTNPVFKDFRDYVMSVSQDIENFRDSEVEATVGE